MSETKRLKIMDGLDIRCPSNSWLGQIIDYMQKIPSNCSSRDLAIEMLFARFLPLILETSSPSNRVMAIECATKCESWAKVIRERWGLNEPTPTYPTVYSLPQLERNMAVTRNSSANFPAPEAETIEQEELTSEELTARAKELEEFEQMLVKTVESSPSAWEAKDKLVEMQPIDDEDWTEAQWDLWNKYTTKQEDIIDQQLLGDLADRLKGGSEGTSGEEEVNS